VVAIDNTFILVPFLFGSLIPEVVFHTKMAVKVTKGQMYDGTIKNYMAQGVLFK